MDRFSVWADVKVVSFMSAYVCFSVESAYTCFSVGSAYVCDEVVSAYVCFSSWLPRRIYGWRSRSRDHFSKVVLTAFGNAAARETTSRKYFFCVGRRSRLRKHFSKVVFLALGGAAVLEIFFESGFSCVGIGKQQIQRFLQRFLAMGCWDPPP